MATVEVTVRDQGDGWTADVIVRSQTMTTHRVRISRAELARYGDGEVADLVRSSFDFLLEREANTSILRDFSLGDIERYFPEYAAEIGRTGDDSGRVRP
jgi:hypothetical protein